MGMIYVASNPAFEDYLKIGQTTEDDVKVRVRNLDSTGVPLPFKCEFVVEIDNSRLNEVEKLLHEVFKDSRVRDNREFFEINLAPVRAALLLTGGKDVTPKEDILDSEDQDTIRRPRRRSRFSDAGVSVDEEIIFSKDESITARVVSDTEIEFEDANMSVSRAALILLNRMGYKYSTVNGWTYWKKDGESMTDRIARLNSRL